MKLERVRIEIEFEMPQNATLADCERLLMKQMKTAPVWDDPAGTGLLNYICYDRTMRIVGARILPA